MHKPTTLRHISGCLKLERKPMTTQKLRGKLSLKSAGHWKRTAGSRPTQNFYDWFRHESYGGPFTSDELAMHFSRIGQDQTSLNREGFVNTVRESRQLFFLPSLIELLTNETDLAVADRLTMAISDLAKEDFHPHDFQRIAVWWKDRHDFFTNWPLTALELGLRAFSSANYAKAAEAFEQVLKLDSGADMSRAHAIACCWETGQTNRAAILAKEFRSPSARWAQWANAKAELETGNVSNATVHFFSLTTNSPSMAALPNQGSHVFRNIDWELFNKLKATEKR